MKIKTLILLVLFSIFYLNCAQLEVKPPLQVRSGNYVNVLRIGVSSSSGSERGVIVDGVVPGTPVQIAGIKEGDILIKIDNVKIYTNRELRERLNNVHSGRDVEITLMRDGSLRTIRVKPEMAKEPSTFRKLDSLVRDNKVTVAIIVGEVSNSISGNVNLDDWKQSIKRNLIGYAEDALLFIFRGDINFRLVDRSIINKVLEEFKLNESGLVSDEMRIKLGKMYGVTHIIKIDFSRYPHGRQGYEDITNINLISLETGIIEASDYNCDTYSSGI